MSLAMGRVVTNPPTPPKRPSTYPNKPNQSPTAEAGPNALHWLGSVVTASNEQPTLFVGINASASGLAGFKSFWARTPALPAWSAWRRRTRSR